MLFCKCRVLQRSKMLGYLSGISWLIPLLSSITWVRLIRVVFPQPTCAPVQLQSPTLRLGKERPQWRGASQRLLQSYASTDHEHHGLCTNRDAHSFCFNAYASQWFMNDQPTLYSLVIRQWRLEPGCKSFSQQLEFSQLNVYSYVEGLVRIGWWFLACFFIAILLEAKNSRLPSKLHKSQS